MAIIALTVRPNEPATPYPAVRRRSTFARRGQCACIVISLEALSIRLPSRSGRGARPNHVAALALAAEVRASAAESEARFRAPIACGRAGPSLLGHILFGKYGLHLPLNRQSTTYEHEDSRAERLDARRRGAASTATLMPLVETRYNIYPADPRSTRSLRPKVEIDLSPRTLGPCALLVVEDVEGAAGNLQRPLGQRRNQADVSRRLQKAPLHNPDVGLLRMAADGRMEDGKQPPSSRPPMAACFDRGLWDTWKDRASGDTIRSATMISRTPILS